MNAQEASDIARRGAGQESGLVRMSLADTVVVLDRIRENWRKAGRKSSSF